MDNSDPRLTVRLAARLRQLRLERGWSLDELAAASGISRASLSRLETAAVSPTAQVLARLCAAHGLSMSHLLAQVEDGFRPVIRAADRRAWRDPETGFDRQVVSPANGGLATEVLECRIPPATRIDYDRPPRPGLEHHLWLCEGWLEVRAEGETHALSPGDCLRYRLVGASGFRTGPDLAARYVLVLT